MLEAYNATVINALTIGAAGAVALLALAIAVVVLVLAVMCIGAAYSWIRYPEYRTAAVDARNREAAARIAAQAAGGRRRAFLRRRAERAAARAREAARANPWLPA